MIKIGIVGYGNLGKGTELALKKNPDMTLAGIFSRHFHPGMTSLTGTEVFPDTAVLDFADEIDVLINCNGSRTDLPLLTPLYAERFNVVDSFDTHDKIEAHLQRVDTVALREHRTAFISGGWDPGLLSCLRVISAVLLPGGRYYTIYGPGLSQGHSDAIRQIPGVKDARQFTIPVPSAQNEVLAGKTPDYQSEDLHTRECYVVVEDGADQAEIEQAIVTMPDYFADYETEVKFVTEEELKDSFNQIDHYGLVVHNAHTGLHDEHRHQFRFNVDFDSNAEATGSMLVAIARAVHRMYERKDYGCKTAFDLTLRDICPLPPVEMRRKYL